MVAAAEAGAVPGNEVRLIPGCSINCLFERLLQRAGFSLKFVGPMLMQVENMFKELCVAEGIAPLHPISRVRPVRSKLDKFSSLASRLREQKIGRK